jgi:deoxyhypusine synthase
LGLAGALIARGLRKLLQDLIEFNLVDCVVSTGAIAYQVVYSSVQSKDFLQKEKDADLFGIRIS